jgi:ribosomal-protein-alanine acetyltransferase
MSPHWRIRRAQVSDLETISFIETYWKTAPHWSKFQIESELWREDSIFFVLEGEADVMGYGLARVVEQEAQILSLSTHPDRIRQGVGRKVLEAVFSEARLRGCLRATLEVSKTNEPAFKLYQGAGFHVVGIRPKFYNDGSDALLMDIILR